jgi:hypothetical protein
MKKPERLASFSDECKDFSEQVPVIDSALNLMADLQGMLNLAAV